MSRYLLSGLCNKRRPDDEVAVYLPMLELESARYVKERIAHNAELWRQCEEELAAKAARRAEREAKKKAREAA